MAHQIRLDLDDESAVRLATLAERAHAQQDDLAVTLLSVALAELLQWSRANRSGH